MSANPHDHAAEEAHTGPIKNPKQLLVAVFFSFVVPIFIIIGLVYYVVSDAKPAGTNSADTMVLGGMTAESQSQAVAARIQKVGVVEIRDANRELKSGEEVFKAQCTTCHTAGVAGAPKFGEASAWAARIATGYEALLHSALKGKGAMGAQGGGDFEDTEIARAVVYMANAGGAKFPVPQKPVAAAPADAASAPQ
ncbi:cytochrome c5 [Rhodoferax ferrireducens]|uniref:Cytochrome c5 n=1 Tax=Rhodoferax ferrireducens TaxID=192843 RepID=A0ABU2CEP2_9BURK|nr:c-type cytochrome [Rhodoferax ferrireducens]MDR7379778.1 cytochrome c5 [Rhodoferax ferrireducens]